jgi:hypothetical protein
MDFHSEQFLTVVLLGTGVIAISMALDVLWARVTPLRSLYYAMRAPGVIVHECSHILGCVITGAKIQNVVFFSEEGGSVTHTPSKIPYIGNVVISTAPLVCIPLVLAGITWAFSQYLGVIFPPMPETVDSMNALIGLVIGVTTLFTQNLIVRFKPWFLVYLYLTVTLVLSLAPSMQDMKNAAIGIGIIISMVFLILLSSLPVLVTILESITRLVGIGFTLGLMFEIIALVISSPLMIWYVYKRS